jgi:hypothetical protein
MPMLYKHNSLRRMQHTGALHLLAAQQNGQRRAEWLSELIVSYKKIGPIILSVLNYSTPKL